MRTPGYQVTCDQKGCTNSEFFEPEDDYLDGDWWNIEGEDFCDGCANARENDREERIRLSAVESATRWGGDIPYESAIRAKLNGE